MSEKQNKISIHSIQTLKAFEQIENIGTNQGCIANDHDHVAFIVKSDFSLPQLSSVIHFIKSRGFIIPIYQGRIFIGTIFKPTKSGFQTHRLNSETYDQIETLLKQANAN